MRKKGLTCESGFMEVTFLKQGTIEQLLYCVIVRSITLIFSYLDKIIKNGRVGSFNIDVTLTFKILGFFLMVTKSSVFLFLHYQYWYGSTFVTLKKTYITSLEIFFNFTIHFQNKNLKKVLKIAWLFFSVYLSKKFTFVHL